MSDDIVFSDDIPIEEDRGKGRTALVAGSPGAGKTAMLTDLVSRAVFAHGFDAVTVCSFTVAAAEEVAGRIVAPIPKGQVGTLHSMCRAMLDGPTLHLEMIGSWNDAHPGYAITSKSRSVQDVGMDAMSFGEGGDAILNEIGVLRARLVPRDQWPPSARSFDQMWEEWKSSVDVVDFSDLLSLAAETTDHAPGDPAVLLVDEAQDLSPLQMLVIERWSARTKWTVLVGDRDQCLYQWSGVDPDALDDWDADFTIPWNRSHRVPRAVGRLANAWIGTVSHRSSPDLLPRDHEGSVDETPWSVRSNPTDLVERLDAHHRAGEESMVLASCAYMLQPVITGLREHGTPFHNPLRLSNGTWNPLPRRSRTVTSADRLLAFTRPLDEVWGDKARWWTGEDLARWVEPMRAKSALKHGAKSWLEEFGPQLPKLPLPMNADPPSSKDLTRLPGVLYFFEESAWPRVFDVDVDWWMDQLLRDRGKRTGFPRAVLERHGATGLTEVPRTVIGSIHSVKGGQASHVYILPDLSRNGWNQWLDRDGRDEVIRLFYVAMTRAREAVHLVPASGPRAVDLAGFARHSLL